MDPDDLPMPPILKSNRGTANLMKFTNAVKKELPGRIFKWKNLCNEIMNDHTREQIRAFGQMFGVPPQHWNNPRKICSLIVPRVNDYLEKVPCDNEDEMTMDGKDISQVPEYLKYTFIHPATGKKYCSDLRDLVASIQAGQTMDPYRRFTLDKYDIFTRWNYLVQILEPHAFGQGFLENVKNDQMRRKAEERGSSSGDQEAELRKKLVRIYQNLYYPAINIEEIINADTEFMENLWQVLLTQDGIHVSNGARHALRSRGPNDKNLLADVLGEQQDGEPIEEAFLRAKSDFHLVNDLLSDDDETEVLDDDETDLDDDLDDDETDLDDDLDDDETDLDDDESYMGL
jgi:hypothetical protein